MMIQDITVNGEVWTVTSPGDITVTDPALNGGVMKIAINYTDASLLSGAAHGIDTVTFTPKVNGKEDGPGGFSMPVELDVTNGMSVPINGFTFMLDNNQPATQPYDTHDLHPTNFAHFHNYGTADFSPETIIGLYPDFTNANGSAAAFLNVSGAVLLPGQTVKATGISAQLKLHNEEHAGQDNGFALSFFINAANPTSPPSIGGVAIDLTATAGAVIKPFPSIVISDPNVFPVEAATINVYDAAGALTDDSSLTLAGLQHTGTGTYTLAPTLPKELTDELKALAMQPTAAQNGEKLLLSVNNGYPTSATTSERLTVQSANASIVTTDGPTLTSADATVWSLVQGQVAVNGAVDPTTSRVVAIAYVNGQLWQENADHNWWYKTTVMSPWQQGTPPTEIANPILPVSANNTILTNKNEVIVDANQHTWSFINGGTVDVDGQAVAGTGHGVALAYVNGVVWENADNLWWGKPSPTADWYPANGQTESPLIGPPVPPAAAPPITFIGKSSAILADSAEASTLSGGLPNFDDSFKSGTTAGATIANTTGLFSGGGSPEATDIAQMIKDEMTVAPLPALENLKTDVDASPFTPQGAPGSVGPFLLDSGSGIPPDTDYTARVSSGGAI